MYEANNHSQWSSRQDSSVKILPLDAFVLLLVDCGRLDNPPNGIVVISATTEGDTATYFCNEGHVFAENGTDQRTCGSNGRWSGDQPSCTGKQ